MNNHDCKLTIVIPAYRVEKYLEQCLESVLHQTKMEHQVIIVDDASPDKTGEIARRYAEKYPDVIRYVRQEKNKGLGAARNRGLQEVDTEYVTFLDSDDWLMPRYIEAVMNRLSKEIEEPEVIFTMPKVYDTVTGLYQDWMDKSLFDSLFSIPSTVINPENEPRIYDLEPSVCRRVFLTRFLKAQKFAFPEGTKWEDVEAHFKLLHAAERCIGVGEVGFVYRINHSGQITSSVGRDRLQVVSVFSRILKFALQNDWGNAEIAHILQMTLSFSKWSMDCISVYLRPELVHGIHKLYRAIPSDWLKYYYKYSHVSHKDKLLIKILRSSNYRFLGNGFTYKYGKKAISKVVGAVNHRRK